MIFELRETCTIRNLTLLKLGNLKKKSSKSLPIKDWRLSICNPIPLGLDKDHRTQKIFPPKYVTPQGEMGHKSLGSQNGLWVPNDAAWNYLPNAFYRIKLSPKLFNTAFGQYSQFQK